MSTQAARITPLTPQTPVTPGNEENEREESRQQLLATSYSGRARAGARACAREEALPRLARYYCATFGRRNCAPVILRAMKEALNAGMEGKTIALCMDAAASAEVPSWAYAAAVMRRCISEGALTPEAFEARSARHRKGGGSGVNFPQRSYQDGELDYIYTDLSKYMDEI